MIPRRAVLADITTLAVDAIVNAANSSLLGGGGLTAPSTGRPAPTARRVPLAGGCPTGEARLTGGYRLPARHVIHTVGPVWQGGRAAKQNSWPPATATRSSWPTGTA